MSQKPRGPFMVPQPAFTAQDRVDFDKIRQDMYFGDGPDNPSVTLRLDRVERAIELFEKVLAKIWRVLWGLLALGAEQLAKAILDHVHVHL